MNIPPVIASTELSRATGCTAAVFAAAGTNPRGLVRWQGQLALSDRFNIRASQLEQLLVEPRTLAGALDAQHQVVAADLDIARTFIDDQPAAVDVAGGAVGSVVD